MFCECISLLNTYNNFDSVRTRLLENYDLSLSLDIGCLHFVCLQLQKSNEQANSPSRIGVFTWHDDMRKLDARVTGITDSVSSLECTCLRDGDF